MRTEATIGGARVPIQVDVGFGDVITPGVVEIDYPVLLDAPTPPLRAYPVGAVVAEKLHALVTLGIANSRLKDYHDLWLIADTFELGRALLPKAVARPSIGAKQRFPMASWPGSARHVESWRRFKSLPAAPAGGLAYSGVLRWRSGGEERGQVLNGLPQAAVDDVAYPAILRT